MAGVGAVEAELAWVGGWELKRREGVAGFAGPKSIVIDIKVRFPLSE